MDFDFDFVSEGLAKELVSGSQLPQCFQVAALLHRLLQQRDKTIDVLSRTAESLNGHYRRAAIAKSAASAVGTGGMIAAGIGAATLIAAPISGGVSLIVAAACAAAGGVAWGAGSGVTAGTLVVERFLYGDIVEQAKKAISRDQDIAAQLKEASDILQCMLESFCDQFQYVLTPEKALAAVLNVYKRVKDCISEEGVDWQGVVSKETRRPRSQIQDVARRAVAVIKPHIIRAFKVMSLNMVNFDIPVGFTVVTLTLGTILAAIDITVLFVNVVRLAKQEEHPGAIKIKSTVENLKDERDRLQSFYRALQESVITITTADT